MSAFQEANVETVGRETNSSAILPISRDFNGVTLSSHCAAPVPKILLPGTSILFVLVKTLNLG